MRGLIILLALFMVAISFIYNNAYEETVANYEAYDFSEFSSSAQNHQDKKICKVVKTEPYTVRSCTRS